MFDHESSYLNGILCSYKFNEWLTVSFVECDLFWEAYFADAIAYGANWKLEWGTGTAGAMKNLITALDKS